MASNKTASARDHLFLEKVAGRPRKGRWFVGNRSPYSLLLSPKKGMSFGFDRELRRDRRLEDPPANLRRLG